MKKRVVAYDQFHQIPPLLLVDCSELELGRNLGRRESRLDDNVAAARRRLAIYREVTLPMLKAFDEKNRLKIVSLIYRNKVCTVGMSSCIADIWR